MNVGRAGDQSGARDGADAMVALVERALDGNAASWQGLVDEFAPLVSSIAQSMCRSSADAADVSQTTWLRLVEHAQRIEQPQRVGAWLATTARRECFRVQQRTQRLTPMDQERIVDLANDLEAPAPDARLLANERGEVVREALDALPARSRELLTLLAADPPISYAEISETLDMPIGSIGPTRARALAMLRREVRRRGITGTRGAA